MGQAAIRKVTAMRIPLLILAAPLVLSACGNESGDRTPGDGDPFAQSQSSMFLCEGLGVEARFIDEKARLVIDSATYDLVRVEADTGTRYAAPNQPDLAFWDRGETGTLSLPGDPDRDCFRRDA